MDVPQTVAVAVIAQHGRIYASSMMMLDSAHYGESLI